MKPSEFKCVKGKKAWILPPNFRCFVWKGYAYCKTKNDADDLNKSDEIDSQLKSHETIHIRQAESTKDSWFRFYVTYVWEWIKNLPLIFVDIYAPYKFEPMEMEAYLQQDNWDYCKNGSVWLWKELEGIPLKTKRQWAKEYYQSKPKPYFTDFLKEKIDGTIPMP